MNDKRDSSERGIVGRIRRLPLFFYAIFFFCFGLAMYVPGVVMVVPRRLFGLNEVLLPFNEWIVWYSGLPVMIGIVLVTADLFLFLDSKRRKGSVRFDPIRNAKVTVALTAYNDEESIAA